MDQICVDSTLYDENDGRDMNDSLNVNCKIVTTAGLTDTQDLRS
jgi:hypothetical protein